MKDVLFKKSLLGLLVAAPFFVASCSKDSDPEPGDDNEQITTVRYVLTPTTGGNAVTVEYRDPDGDGAAAPTIGTLTLAPNTTYTGRLTLLDETKTPPENITEEIEDESDEHLFVFTPTGTNVTVTITDRDEKNLPVGLQTRVVTGAANATGTTGSLRVVLRHQPEGKDGTPTPGDTDVDVNFPTVVR
ncbi:hypothetical protein SAMN00120144_2837 [Hymenobacter roseosalivarius DSM 11622]|uniref:Type 1 periplasmic binding fold superfamily protein n=1 Tax=Hymenobacter roseosalivarius DSM 11622 TaxID=645990 RepID=A0A1W1UWT7_9BACT|nr:hypothetical protein [Hymenobacter roseosalivarius]SMB85553.1 hypothetical protein SAMN00120144_2837 [Hymenobacter roseosalivarius DSM 11622]